MKCIKRYHLLIQSDLYPGKRRVNLSVNPATLAYPLLSTRLQLTIGKRRSGQSSPVPLERAVLSASIQNL
jgi:hypothetical protein